MKHPEWTLAHFLLNAVEKNPHAVAVIDGATSYTYADVMKKTSQMSVALHEYGMKRGERVGVYVEKSLEALVSMLAIVWAGGVYVNINPQLKEDQVTHIMRNCQISMLVIDDNKTALKLPSVRVRFVRESNIAHISESNGVASALELETPIKTLALNAIFSSDVSKTPDIVSKESDLSTIIYTSGSTGMPKGIMLSHHNVVVGAQIVSTYLENTSSDRILSLLPLNFDVGMNQFTTMLRVAGTLVLQKSMWPGDILKALRTHEITGLAGVPSVWTLLLQNEKSLLSNPLEHLRYISNTGGQIPQPNVDKLVTVLPHTKVILMYGLTEAFRSTYLPSTEIHRGSQCIGRAIPNTDIWVVNEQGQECAVDEVGELIHKGPTVALGYWGDAEKTNAVYRINPFAPKEMLEREMVVYSGDLVKRDADGYLHYVGRRDEQIKTQGYRLSPSEIEELLYSTGVVYEAAAFGEKDLMLGHKIITVVAFKENTPCTPQELRRICSERAPSHMVPHVVHVLDVLPKNANGKIDRSLLRKEYVHG